MTFPVEIHLSASDDIDSRVATEQHPPRFPLGLAGHTQRPVMPFNEPIHSSASGRRQPSPPQRNPSTASNASTSTTASSTSSLEAAPMKPPPIQTRTAVSGAEPGRSGSGGASARQGEEQSRSPTTPRMGSTGADEGDEGEGSFARGMANGMGMNTVPMSSPYHTRLPTPNGAPYNPAGLDFPAHLLPAELRPSASGPDLASLRQRMVEERRERSRSVAARISGGEAGPSSRPFSADMASSTELDPAHGGTVRARPKARTRSSSTQVAQANPRAGPSGAATTGTSTPLSGEARKLVSLADFDFGEMLGRGSYSTVVLAQQKATRMPYAIKILDQQHLLREKKSKYAKIERDALVLLGPRHAVGYGSRRGSVAESTKSARSGKSVAGGGVGGRSEVGRKRESGGAGEGEVVMPRFRRVGSGESVPQANGARGQRMSGEGQAAAQDGQDVRSPVQVMRRVSDVEEHDEAAPERLAPDSSGQAQPAVQSISISTQNLAVHDAATTAPHSPVHRPHSVLSDATLMDSPSASRRLSLSASASTIGPDAAAAMHAEMASRRTTITDGEKQRLSVTGQEERRRRARLSHPGVVRLHYTFKDDSSLYFVLDLAINGELLSYIKKYGSFDTDSARIYAAQIIDTIDFMHERGVIHRDVKPENILLDDDMRVKVTDFGSAKIVAQDVNAAQKSPETDTDRKRSFVGTAEYVSPEVLRNEHASAASDVWAFGCVLFQMLAGRPPFRGKTEYLTFQDVLKVNYEFPEGFDDAARDLLSGIFRADPADRPPVTAIKAHPFFASVNFDEVWLDQMPEIKSGLLAPAPAPASRSSDGEWDEAFSPAGDESDDPFAAADVPTDDDVLEAPRRRWLESGGGAGTFSSGSGETDEDASLRGVNGSTSQANISTGSGSPEKLRQAHLWSPSEKQALFSAFLKPQERVVYSSPILCRAGLVIPKRRTLVLTDSHRLICVKEDLIKGKITVKSDSKFAPSRGGIADLDRDRTGTDATEKHTITSVVKKGPRAFIVQTASKECAYIADRPEIRDRWIKELRAEVV